MSTVSIYQYDTKTYYTYGLTEENLLEIVHDTDPYVNYCEFRFVQMTN